MTIVCSSNRHDLCAGQEVPWTISAPDSDLRTTRKLTCAAERPCSCWCHRYVQRPRALQENK